MQSLVQNRSGEVVERIEDHRDIMLIQNDAGAVVLPDYSFQLRQDLGKNRYYEIKRMRINITDFKDPTTLDYAFPQWEQFAFVVRCKAQVVDSLTGSVQLDLWDGLIYSTTDGTHPVIVFKEPFVFDTFRSTGNPPRILLTFTDAGSVFVTLNNIILPPQAPTISVFITGTVVLEGVSYSAPAGQIDQVENSETQAAAGINLDNAIDIDI
jgi:hypothetical protein